MNQPNETWSLPIADARPASYGVPSRDAIPRNSPPVRRPTGAEVPASSPQPTLFEAVSRHRVLVLLLAVLGLVGGTGYALMPPKQYNAEGFITMPQQVSLQAQQSASSQYLDSQVLILQSQEVAQQAAKIADAALNGAPLSVDNFFGVNSQLMVTPPTTAAPGVYGATVIGVTFTGSTPQIAQEGANAVLAAYTQVRTADIKAEDSSVIDALGTSIGATNFQLSHLPASATSEQQQLVAQRAALTTQQAQAIVNEDMDLAQQSSVQTAPLPAKPSNHKWSIDGAAGLVGGLLLGAAVAFMLARRKASEAGQRRRGAADRDDVMPEPPRRSGGHPQQQWR